MRPARQGWALLWGWTPIAVLITALIVIAHGGPWLDAARVALRLVIVGAVLGAVVHRFCARHPWPHPFRPRFLAVHLAGAAVYASSFLLSNVLLESLMQHRLVLILGPGTASYTVLGIWLYVMVAGISYANDATARAAALEAQVAKAQLAALQAQLHPHFLFNALHTIVQLIESDPKGAVRAAELLADALREAIDEGRAERPLGEELAFVHRYLALESLRFGPRLRISSSVPKDLLDAYVPTFALQTLVENAVRHGAAPSITPTTVTLEGRGDEAFLRLRVQDDGVGDGKRGERPGGGLSRLRERLAALYGDRARLDIHSAPGAGFEALLVIPRIEEAQTR